MFNKSKLSEILIFSLSIVLIFIAEYYFVVLKNPMKAIFIGLWTPTILGLLIYINLKKKQNEQ